MQAFAMAGKNPPTEPTTPTPPPKPPTTPPKPPTTPPVSSSDITPLWESKHADGREWTSHVMRELDHLGQDLLETNPADKNSYCPKYNTFSYAQRKQYWAFVMSSMVRFESNFKPATYYKENFKDSNGDYIYSRGLLQISIESGNAYGCDFRSSKDLHDPYQNLSCGIRILNRWVSRDGRIAGKVSNQWRGGARYWSVMRTTSGSHASIKQWSNDLDICK